MSTYLYLRCEDHDPPLLSEGEVTQHAHRESEMADVLRWIKNRDVIVEQVNNGEIDMGNYFLRAAAAFLARHPKCRLGLEDEYGRDFSIETGKMVEA